MCFDIMNIILTVKHPHVQNAEGSLKCHYTVQSLYTVFASVHSTLYYRFTNKDYY